MKNIETFSDRLVDLHTGQRGLRQLLSIKTTPVPEAEGDVLDIVVSDETVDRYNEVIRADGWQLDNYRKNPVIQNAHQYGDVIFTIGKALKTEVSGGKLTQRWQFASAENPMAKIAAGLYRGGYLRASSVGFIPMDWEDGNVNQGPSRTFTRQELLEVSAVAIPANPSALTLAVKSGAIEKADLRELERLLHHFCNDQADPSSKAGSSRTGIEDEQWLQLGRAVADVMKRA